MRSFKSGVKALGGPLTVMGGLMTGLAVKTTLTAARTEELGIVLRNVAKNAGISMRSIQDQEKAITDLGITTQVADQLLIKMMQNELDLSRATDLARLAQDAAVISMEDSSQALGGILDGILTLQPEMLRHRGLMVNLEQEYAKWAKTNGRTVQSLTSVEKQTIAMNAALASGKNIAGTYEAAMESAGKQMRSMSRHAEEAANEFGQHLVPVLGAVVEVGTGVLKWARDLPEPVKATVAQVGALGGVFSLLAGSAIIAVPKVIALGSAIAGLGIGILGPLGLVAALATSVIALKNAEKQHREMAAEIAATSNNYPQYLALLEEEGLAHYAIAEGLYAEAKARKETEEADEEYYENLQEGQEAVDAMLSSLIIMARMKGDWAENFQQIRNAVRDTLPFLGEFEKQVLGNREALLKLLTQQGLTADQADELARALGMDVAAFDRAKRANEAYASGLETTELREHKLRKAMMEGNRALEESAEAAQLAATAYYEAGDAAAIQQAQLEGLVAEAQRTAEAEQAAADAADDFAGSMELLRAVIAGEIGEAMEEYRREVEGLQGSLASGTITQEEFNASLEKSTEAFRENTNAIIFNIAEKQILDALEKGLIADVNASGTAFDEANTILWTVAETLGLVDQETLALMQSVQEQTQAVIDGSIEADTYALRLGNMAGKAGEAALGFRTTSAEIRNMPEFKKFILEYHTRYTQTGQPPPVTDPETGVEITTPEGGYAFQHGGAFRVGGPPGVDKTPVFFMASRGEMVTVTPAGDMQGIREMGRASQAGTVLPNPLVKALMAIAKGMDGKQKVDQSMQYIVYGGQHLHGVEDRESLLAQLVSVQ